VVSGESGVVRIVGSGIRSGWKRHSSFRLSWRAFRGCDCHQVPFRYHHRDQGMCENKIESVRGRFVCLHTDFSRGTLCFDFASDVEDDIGIKIEAVLVVPAPALAAIPIGPMEEPEHMEVREVVLNAFEGCERFHGV